MAADLQAKGNPRRRLAGMCGGLALVAALGAGANLAAAPVPTPDGQVKVVLKFVKSRVDAALPAVQFIASSCPACRLIDDPAFGSDNRRETLVALTVPRRRTLALQFRAAPGSIRRVILESGDLRFEAGGDVLTVSMPPAARDVVNAGEFSTHIVEPGMVLRFEHADPLRRAGAYADGAFPDLQRRAADNLEFAMREMIRLTGLGEHVAREGLGTIQVMGFDTNYPHGHTDAPPHVHMHLRWPANTGTQIGHWYIDARGLLEKNIVGYKGLGGPGKTYGRGEPFTTIDLHGRAVYTHEITAEGWLKLGRAGQAPCLLRPVAQGFDSGAIVQCPQHAAVRIDVTDDMQAGKLQVRSGAVHEVFLYDRDTGKLLSDSQPPAATESIHVPHDHR